MKTIQVPELSDLFNRALQVDGYGPYVHCPRCRLARAATALGVEHWVSCEYWDEMLGIASTGISGPCDNVTTREELDRLLRQRAATLELQQLGD